MVWGSSGFILNLTRSQCASRLQRASRAAEETYSSRMHAKPCHCPSNEERDCQQSLLLLPSQASFPYSFSFRLPLTPHGIPIPRRPFLPFTLTSQINQMPSEVPSNALIFALLNFGPITNKPATSMVLLGVLKWAKMHSQYGCFPRGGKSMLQHKRSNSV